MMSHYFLPLKYRLLKDQSECNYQIADYIHDIKQELESLLNIVSSDLLDSIKKELELKYSILNLGLPLHMKWGSMKVNDYQQILDRILVVISHHEPRIIQPSVYVDYAMPTSGFQLNLCIEGSVVFSNKKSDLFIRSQCFPLDMRFKVL